MQGATRVLPLQVAAGDGPSVIPERREGKSSGSWEPQCDNLHCRVLIISPEESAQGVHKISGRGRKTTEISNVPQDSHAPSPEGAWDLLLERCRWAGCRPR